MKIKYNVQIEVSERQYTILSRDFAGIVCHRSENGQYFIKCFAMQYASTIKRLLTKTNP